MSTFASRTGASPGVRLLLSLACALGAAELVDGPGAHALQQETTEVHVDADWLSAIVQNDSIPMDLRAGAARRMAASDQAQVVGALGAILVSADAQRLQVIASGVRQAERMPAAAIPSLITNACTTGALRGEHLVMLRVGGEASIDALARAAIDGEAACRGIAIRALGGLRSRPATESLVELLDVVPPDSE